MINLLPPELKSSYRYARRNVTLRAWVWMFLFAAVGLGGLATFGLLTLQQSSTHNNTGIAAIQSQLDQEHLEQTKDQVQNISNDLKLAVKVLGQEVLFSKLITQIGAAMPNGAVLTSLTIDSVSGGLDLTANTSDYTTATQVQVNLADPTNKIFSKADIVSINCGSASTDAAHPCLLQLRALFGTNSQFLFINQGSKT